MEPVSLEGLPENALLLIDSAPIIYVLEGHPELAAVFRPVFEAHDEGLVRLAVTPVTLAEVLTGPLGARDEVLAERYRATLKSWFVVDLDAEIAESAARLRAACKLKLADAVQAAGALAIGADALVTHDRDFSALRDLRVLGVVATKAPEQPQ
jgi:predicted nucleic acid-binding protein